PFQQQQRTQFLLQLLEQENSVLAGGDSFWITGTVRFRDYDFSTQSFPVSEVNLRHINVFRSDFHERSIEFELNDVSQLSIRLSPEDAKGVAEHSEREQFIRLRVTPIEAG